MPIGICESWLFGGPRFNTTRHRGKKPDKKMWIIYVWRIWDITCAISPQISYCCGNSLGNYICKTVSDKAIGRESNFWIEWDSPFISRYLTISAWGNNSRSSPQITNFMRPTCQPQMGPMLAPLTLLSGSVLWNVAILTACKTFPLSWVGLMKCSKVKTDLIKNVF